MRYTITPDEFVEGKYIVEHPLHGHIASCTEAEAKIIAFALDNVAIGWELQAVAPSGDGFILYQGPTEGVAP